MSSGLPGSQERRERLAERISAASYGTVLIIAALLVVESEDVASGWGWELMVGVGVATWVAHVYAEVLGHHVRDVDGAQAHGVRHAMADGLPILLSAVLPASVLLLGRAGAMAPRLALWIAVVVALLQLIAIGALVGVVSSRGSSTLRYAAAAALFGLGVVLLLVALGH